MLRAERERLVQKERKAGRQTGRERDTLRLAERKRERGTERKIHRGRVRQTEKYARRGGDRLERDR